MHYSHFIAIRTNIFGYILHIFAYVLFRKEADMSLFVTITGYILGFIIILCISLVCSAPFKTAARLIFNSFAGCIFLSIANLYLANIDVHIGISPFTAVFTGVLGLPGAIAVILLRFIV